MNILLSAFLSVNLLLSSILSPTLFIVTPNPFSNVNIRYDFDSANDAATYYYMQLKNNAISYSDSDILTMLCVLANIYVQDKAFLTTDMIDNIQYYYEHDLIGLPFWIQHDLPLFNMLGYIVKPDSSFFSKAGKWLYNRFISASGDPSVQEFPHIYYFAYLYDNFSFDRYGIEPSTSLKTDIEAAANDVQSVPYVLYDYANPYDYVTSDLPWYNSEVYTTLLSDIESYSSSHDFFSLFLFYSSSFHHSYVSSSASSSSRVSLQSGSSITGYCFVSLDSTPIFVRSSSQNITNALRVDHYNSNWASQPIVASTFCRYIDINSRSLVVAPSSYYITLTGDYFTNLSTVSGYALSKNDIFSKFLIVSPDYYFYRRYGSYGTICTWFSTKYDQFPVFNSLEDLKNYTLSNGLYFRAEPSEPVQKITYESYNSYNDLYIANQTTYNSVNNYVTENNITNIDNSTQTIINNYYNFDLEFNFNLTINNIKNLQGDQDTHINHFWQSFNDSGYKNFNFNSWSNPDGTESSWSANFNPVIALINTFYNDLPSKIQMCIAGVLVVGLFGLILGVVSKLKTRGKDN